MARVLNLDTYYYWSNFALALLVIVNVVIMITMVEEQDQRIRLSNASSKQQVLLQHIGYSSNLIAQHLQSQDFESKPLIEYQAKLTKQLQKIKRIQEDLLNGQSGIFFQNRNIIQRYYEQGPYYLSKHYSYLFSKTEALSSADYKTLSKSQTMALDITLQVADSSMLIVGSNALTQELTALSYRQVKNLKHTQIILAVVTLFILLVETLFIFKPLNKKLLHEHRKLLNSREQLKKSSLNDSLTKLGNRRLFDIAIENAISDYEILEKPFTLLMADLDRFKPINDNYGHQAGDQVLIEVANRLSQSVRQSDTVTRLGGDEFAIILQNLNDREAVEQILRKITEEIAKPIIHENIAHSISVSIGVAAFPRDGSAKEALIQHADEHMYDVKKVNHASEA